MHLGTAQIQIAVSQTQSFIGLHVIGDVKGRGQRGVENLDPVYHHLHCAGGHGWIFRAGGPSGHRPFHLDHPLGPHLVGQLVSLGGQLRIEHNLNHTGAVPQVDEDDPAVVPAAAHPAGQGLLGVDLFYPEVAAIHAFQFDYLLWH